MRNSLAQRHKCIISILLRNGYDSALSLFFSLSLSFSPYHLAVCVIPCCLWKLTPTVKQKKMIVSVSASSPLSMCRIFESDFARQSFWNRFMTNVYFPRFLQVCQKKSRIYFVAAFCFLHTISIVWALLLFIIRFCFALSQRDSTCLWLELM